MTDAPGVLFINKCATSKSLSRSTGAERASIFSHVQRNPQCQPARPTLTPDNISYEQGCTTAWQAYMPPISLLKKSKSQVQDKKRARNTHANRSSGPRDHSPLSAISLSMHDPFYTTAVPITPYMNHVLQFCQGLPPLPTPISDSCSQTVEQGSIEYSSMNL